ncbi:MAG TPA: hypothetical protein VEX62_07990 [Candidatus Limnocylindrales bacterium]|nr:hypothetical protein [Candidatus Limnocylindrales bacterium]
MGGGISIDGLGVPPAKVGEGSVGVGNSCALVLLGRGGVLCGTSGGRGEGATVGTGISEAAGG